MLTHQVALFLLGTTLLTVIPIEATAGFSCHVNKLLSKFSPETSRSLKSLNNHIKVEHWWFDVIAKKCSCSKLKIVSSNNGVEEEAFCLDSLAVQWTEYKYPEVDLSLGSSTITLALSAPGSVPTTNWQRLGRSGFPPTFPKASKTSKKSNRSAGLRFRRIKFSGPIHIKFQATIFGRTVPARSDVVLAGEMLTELWDRILDEAGESSLDVNEAISTLTHLIIAALVEEVAAYSVGEQGHMAAALSSGLERVLQEALLSVDTHFSQMEKLFPPGHLKSMLKSKSSSVSVTSAAAAPASAQGDELCSADEKEKETGGYGGLIQRDQEEGSSATEKSSDHQAQDEES